MSGEKGSFLGRVGVGETLDCLSLSVALGFLH